jgi:hypothetical protein
MGMWPAWKVSLFGFLFAFVGLLAIAGIAGGGFSSDDPRDAGEKVGQTYGWICLAAPLIGYVAQKWRIDRAAERQERARVPMAGATERGHDERPR